MDGFEKRRKVFMNSIRGGEKSSINRKRRQEAREFHEKFSKKLNDDKETKEAIGKEPGE